MIPTETFDPRDPWMKPRRMELVRYAAELGLTDIVEQMPKEVIVKRLKAKGISPPNVPPRGVGKNLNPRSGDTTPTSHHYKGPQEQQVETVVVDADDLLEKEWEASLKSSGMKSVDDMNWNEMRAEVKARGIKLDRKWRMNDVKAILNGQNAP